MKIAIILLAISIIISWFAWIRTSDNVSKVNDNVKHQQELINRLTWDLINQWDEIRSLKKEMYVHEVAKAYDIIDESDFDMRQWEFETKYMNDIVFVNHEYGWWKDLYICVDTNNKIIVSNCTYFQYK